MSGRSRFGTGAAAFWAGAGAVLAWLAFSWLDDDRVTAAGPSSAAREMPDRVAPTAVERTEEASDSAPSVQPEAEGRPGSPDTEPADRPSATNTNNPIVATGPPSNSPSTPTDLANRRDEDAATPAVALLDLPRISCDFAAGNNTGLRQEALLTVGGGAKWMGGPLIYDFYRTSPGTARLTGLPSVTGSPDGEAVVQVTTEGTRVFLSGFLENRAYVVVTIFDELDNVGRHIAVMSRHERSFSYASQFLGTCQ
jgi:hypothetical protein